MSTQPCWSGMGAAATDAAAVVVAVAAADVADFGTTLAGAATSAYRRVNHPRPPT